MLKSTEATGGQPDRIPTETHELPYFRLFVDTLQNLDGKEYPLFSEQQILQCKLLGLSDKRKGEIHRKIELSKEFLGRVRNNIPPKSILDVHIGDLYKALKNQKHEGESLYLNGIIPAETKELIIDLNKSLFTKENLRLGIPYIATAGGLRNEYYNFLVPLLHSWYFLGPSHERFGKIPLVEGNYTPQILEIFQSYGLTRIDQLQETTPELIFEKNHNYAYSILCIRNGVSQKGYVGLKKRGKISGTFRDLPLYLPSEDSCDIFVGYMEELFILGLLNLNDGCHPKVIKKFFDKHDTLIHLLGHEEIQFLKTVGVDTSKIKEQVIPGQKGVSKGHTIQKNQQELPKKLHSKNPPINLSIKQDQPIPEVPEINDIFSDRFQKSDWNKIKLNISEICKNIPIDMELYVGVVAGTNISKIGVKDNCFSVEPPKSGKQKILRFYFVKPGKVPNKNDRYAEMSISRPADIKAITLGIPERVHQQLPAYVPPISSLVQERSLTPVPTLPDSKENAINFIVGLSDSIIIGMVKSEKSLLTVVKSGNFSLRYDIKTQKFLLSNPPGGVTGELIENLLGQDIQSKITEFLQNQREQEKQEILSTLSFGYAFTRDVFREVGNGVPIPDIERFISDTATNTDYPFFSTRIREQSGALYFLEGSYDKVFDKLKKQYLDEYGLYIKVTGQSRTEVTVTCSLAGKENISAFICSKSTAPYYELSDMSNLKDMDIPRELTKVLKHLLFMLSTVGIALKQSNDISVVGGYVLVRGRLIDFYNRDFRMQELCDPKTEDQKIQEIYEKIQRGESDLKVCSNLQIEPIEVPSADPKAKKRHENIYIYTISKLQNGSVQKALQDAPDTTRVIYRDECLSFQNSKSGHANIYNRIRLPGNLRLRKYLSLRMAQVLGVRLRDDPPDPIPEWAAFYIREAFGKLTGEVRDSFRSCFGQNNDGSVGKSLQVLSENERVFDILLRSLEENKVKILYRAPGMIQLGKIRSYHKSQMLGPQDSRVL